VHNGESLLLVKSSGLRVTEKIWRFDHGLHTHYYTAEPYNVKASLIGIN
jgi:hypothetical protein